MSLALYVGPARVDSSLSPFILKSEKNLASETLIFDLCRWTVFKIRQSVVRKSKLVSPDYKAEYSVQCNSWFCITDFLDHR